MVQVNQILETLKQYIADIESNEILREHEERFYDLRIQIDKKAGRLKAPLNVVSKRLFKTADDAVYCTELFNYKFYLLAKGIINAIEDENPLSLANNTRSLLEQLAVFTYLMNNISQMLTNLKDQCSLEKIDKIVSKCEITIKRVYFGEGKKGINSNRDKAIHVNTAMAELSKEIIDADDMYGYLCEFVHPNYGNNLLISSGKLGQGKINRQSNNSTNVNDLIMHCHTIFTFLNEKKIALPLLALRISHIVELCFVKGAKITNIFSEKKPIASGDGKTKETAFYFEKARTSPEALKLQYRYLESIGHIIKPMDRRNGGIKDGYVYDVWNTKLGIIWFKTPVIE